MDLLGGIEMKVKPTDAWNKIVVGTILYVPAFLVFTVCGVVCALIWFLSLGKVSNFSLPIRVANWHIDNYFTFMSRL